MPIDDEVLVDAVFALAHLAVHERLIPKLREPSGNELAASTDFIRCQGVLLRIGIDHDLLERRDDLESSALDARKSVRIVDGPRRKIRIREALVARRRPV